MLVDSHCHLNCLDLSEHQQQLPQALRAADDQGIKYMLCVAIDFEHWSEVLSIAQAANNIFASIGVHPNEWEGYDPSVDELVAHAKHEKVIAIGETGLDFYRSAPENLAQQRDRFRRHIAAAKISQKPLIIHMREADADTIQILREEQADTIGGVMHCFTSTAEVAKQALDLNFYISISGIVTFKNAQALQQVAKTIPLDRLLIETDAPYLAPMPLRGKSNEPAYLKHTAEFLAQLRGIDFETFSETTTNNFFNLFKCAKRSL
jgi:TatD DNase family protein